MATNEDKIREAKMLLREATVIRSYLERLRSDGGGAVERYAEGGFYDILISPEFATALAADEELKHINPVDIVNLFGLIQRVRAVIAGEAVEAAPGSLGIVYRTRIS